MLCLYRTLIYILLVIPGIPGAAALTHLVFFVISDGECASTLDLREYALVVVLSRFVRMEDVVVVSSSSERLSGTARFLPLASREGSLIVNAGLEG